NALDVWEEELGINIASNMFDMIQDRARRMGFDYPERSILLPVDIYMPPKLSSKRYPLFIAAHGGAFIKGSRKDKSIMLLCQELARHGIIAAAIDYRLMNL